MSKSNLYPYPSIPHSSSDHRDESLKEIKVDLKEIRKDQVDILLAMKDLVQEDVFTSYREANQNRFGKVDGSLSNLQIDVQQIKQGMLTEEKVVKVMDNYLDKPSVQTILVERIDAKKRQGRRNLWEDWTHLQKAGTVLLPILLAVFSFYMGKTNQESISQPTQIERGK